MTKILKRSISVMLTLCLIVGMLTCAISVSADGNLAKIGDTEYATLQDAYNAVSEGGTVTLLGDCTSGLSVSKTFTLDLNGYSVNNTGNSSTDALVLKSGVITIVDTSEAQTGSVYHAAGTHVVMWTNGSGKAAIYGGTYYVKEGASASANNSVFAANLDIYGGTFLIKSQSQFFVSSNTVNIYGGNFDDDSITPADGYEAVQQEDGTWTVSEIVLCDHTWDAGVVTDPTCETDGYTTYTCALCGKTKTDNIVASSGHTYTDSGVVTDPTCDTQGYTTYTCSKCNQAVKDDYVDALGHAWVAGDSLDATCTTDGYIDYACSVCNDTKRDIISSPGHNYVGGICSVCEYEDPDYDESEFDADFTAIMANDYYSLLTFGSDDNGLANYNLVSIGNYSNMYASSFNGRYNFINYSSGTDVEIVSKEGFVVPYGFTVSWEIFTATAESGTTELSVGNLRFVTDYGTKTLYLMLGETELGHFETGCTDSETFRNMYGFNEFTVKYIDGVITVTRLINVKGDTTATNEPITWTLPDGTTSTDVEMPADADFTYSLLTWKSSSEIGKLTYLQAPAPFNSAGNGNTPMFSNVHFDGNNGFSGYNKYARFVAGLADNLNQADVTKARAIYDAIVANGSATLVAEVTPLGELIKAAEKALLEGITCDYDVKATVGGNVYCDDVLFVNDKDNNPIDFGVEKTFTAVADTGYTFAYWANGDGDIITTDKDITVITNFKLALTAVFVADNAADTVTVRFNDYTGNCVATITTAANEAVTLPAMPFTYGYTFKGWSINGELCAAGTEYTFTKDTIVSAFVAKDSTTYKVTVTGAEIEYDNTYTYNTKFELKFNRNLLGDDEKFAGWSNGTNIVSYDEEYTFYVGADVELEALIDTVGITAEPIINVTDVSVVSDGSKASFLTERWMPEGGQYIESGAIYTKDLNLAGKLTVDGVNGTTIRKTTSKYNTARGQFRVNLGSKDGGSDFYLVGYLTYLDADGVITTIYSSVYNATTTVAAN